MGDRKLATEADLLPDRNSLHKYMAEPGSCDECHGRGYYHTSIEDVYCQCAAGKKRREIEK